MARGLIVDFVALRAIKSTQHVCFEGAQRAPRLPHGLMGAARKSHKTSPVL